MKVSLLLLCAAAASAGKLCSHTTCKMVTIEQHFKTTGALVSVATDGKGKVITARVMEVTHSNDETTCHKHSDELVPKHCNHAHCGHTWKARPGGNRLHCGVVRAGADKGQCQCHHYGDHPNGVPASKSGASPDVTVSKTQNAAKTYENTHSNGGDAAHKITENGKKESANNHDSRRGERDSMLNRDATNDAALSPVIRTNALQGDVLNFEPTFFAKETGGWSTCTCKDGSTYECKSKHGDGDQCCTRSMPAICGEGNVPTDRTKGLTGVALVFDNPQIQAKEDGGPNGWHTCTCADGTTYECKSKHGDGAQCCTRSKPAICGTEKDGKIAALAAPIIRTNELQGDGLNFDPTTFQAKLNGGWHTCTCKDGSTYQCKSKHGDGDQCCGRSMPALCGEGNVPDDRCSAMGNDMLVFDNPQIQAKEDGGENGWHTCTCADGSTYECKSKHGDGAQCCTRSKPAICGETSKFTTGKDKAGTYKWANWNNAAPVRANDKWVSAKK